MKRQFLVSCVLLVALVLIAACVPIPTAAPKPAGEGIANPASENCVKQGGTLEIRKETAGEVGYCKFTDGSECEEWAFMRGECKAGKPAATFTDPFAYCAAVGTLDAPDNRYTGPKTSEMIAKGVRKALGTSDDAPLQPFVDATTWRCMDGKVVACFVGANQPCGEKADTNKTPNTGIVDYCKANPAAEFVPAVAAGRATVYEWRCKAGAPEIVKQLLKPDARGFISDIWYAITPPAVAGMANPASENCVKQGGTLEIRKEAAGEVGYCKFADGSECEEWAYMRGECKPGKPAATVSFTDPFAFCAAAGTLDKPDARYTGPKTPDAVVADVRKALGTKADAPNQPFVDGTSWRCADGKVVACFVGANLPCGEKADTNKTANTGIVDYCKANPAAEVVPAVAAGRATVYEWRCKAGAPEIVKQIAKPDAQGFIAEIWYPIAK